MALVAWSLLDGRSVRASKFSLMLAGTWWRLHAATLVVYFLSDGQL